MDLSFIWECLRVAARFAPVTLYISLSAFLIGLLFGIPIALIRFFKVPFLARFFEWLINISNSIPLLLTLTLTYLIFIPLVPYLGALLGQSWQFKDFNREWIAILVLAFFATNYISEAVRSVLEAIPDHQWEAASSVGLGVRQTLRRIIFPQATHSVIPIFGNIINQLIKGSALVSAVSVVDLLNGVIIRAQSNYKYLEAYIAAAIVYWIICSFITGLFKLFSKFVTKGGWAYD